MTSHHTKRQNKTSDFDNLLYFFYKKKEGIAFDSVNFHKKEKIHLKSQ